MEDDIDIEEHDVLEHPRIRCMFPDLSRVKTEVVDEEPETTIDYADIQIKEEIDDSELYGATDHIEFNQIQTELNLIPPLTFSNKIVLGSKPNDYMEEEEPIEEHKEECYAVALVLEDCKSKLEDSGCFCEDCGTLFPTPNSLELHNMHCHSLLVVVPKNRAVKTTVKNFARKSTSLQLRKSAEKNPNSKFCRHCNQVFSDHTALIKHLYKLLQFSCSTCNASFNKQEDLVAHNAIHVKAKNLSVVKKEVKHVNSPMVKKEFKPVRGEKVKEEKSFSQEEVESEVSYMPISHLFQCPVCNLTFLSYVAASLHLHYCTKDLCNTRRAKTCNLCKRMFRAADLPNHLIQHSLANTLKVQKISTNNQYDKILCRCIKCNIYFHEMSMHKHKCGSEPSIKCTICKINLFDCQKQKEHITSHKTDRTKPKDFILIDYCDTKTKPESLKPKAVPLKRKIPLDDNLTHKKSRTEVSPLRKRQWKLNRIIYCRHCNQCMHKSKNMRHMTKACKRNIYSNRSIVCPECGLHFNAKTIPVHKQCHSVHNLSLKDFKFIYVDSGKELVPPIPKYPRCKQCQINFFKSDQLHQHICGEDYKTCRQCKEKYHNSAYNIHLEFHKLSLKTKRAKTESPEISQLSQFDMSWNILYSCLKCDLVMHSYDQSIHHSQAHLKSPNYSPKDIKCYICALKVEETSWPRHSELHSQRTITQIDFQTLKFNPKNLATEEWYELFSSLEESHIAQITEQSLYDTERRVKMSLLKHGLPEFTLYQCSHCQCCISPSEISPHLEVSCLTNSGFFCEKCNLFFSDTDFLEHHSSLHERGVKSDEFRIVAFFKEHINQYSSTESNQHTSTEVTARKGLHGYKKHDGKYHLFKCRNCKNCLHWKANVLRHVCTSAAARWKCRLCSHQFLKTSARVHRAYHNKFPDFKRSEMKIVLFVPRGNVRIRKKIKIKTKPTRRGKKDVVYKCACDLHFTSLRNIQVHQKCCGKKAIHSERCSKCGLMFPTEGLVSHLIKHHGNNRKFRVENYRHCADIESDNETDDISLNNADASEIDQTSKHQTVTEIGEPSISEDRTEEISQGSIDEKSGEDHPAEISRSSTADVTKRKIVKLFKCHTCNVHYINQNTCYIHVYKDHVPLKPKQYIECKLCGLQFTLKTLPSHISKHHASQLNLDQVLIEDYHPPVGSDQLKVETYYAYESKADRVQSLQVTSSIE